MAQIALTKAAVLAKDETSFNNSTCCLIDLVILISFVKPVKFALGGWSINGLSKKIGCKPTTLRSALHRGVRKLTVNNFDWISRLTTMAEMEFLDLWDAEFFTISRKRPTKHDRATAKDQKWWAEFSQEQAKSIARLKQVKKHASIAEYRKHKR